MPSNEEVKTERVDGQAVYVPDAGSWESLLRRRECAGSSFAVEGLEHWWRWTLDFVRRHREFAIALYRAGLPAFKLSPLVLLRTRTGWQRVHIEHLQCEVCDWCGATANPTIPDLYVGTPDRWGALKEAERHPVLPCPKCGSKLPRHPIWTEPLTQNKATPQTP